MSTETQTKPETGQDQGDKQRRHIVQRLTPNGHVPPLYARFALCGKEVKEILLNHGEDICQECVDIMSKVPREGGA